MLAQSRNVPFGRGGDVSTFIFKKRRVAPGMIEGRLILLGGQGLIEILGHHDFRLLGLLVKNIVGQRLAIVKQNNILFVILADGHGCVSQGVAGSFGCLQGNPLPSLNSQ